MYATEITRKSIEFLPHPLKLVLHLSCRERSGEENINMYVIYRSVSVVDLIITSAAAGGIALLVPL